LGEFAATLVIIGMALSSAGLAWLVRLWVRAEARRRYYGVGAAVFLQLGVVFAVLLAFVFSEVWTEYNTAAAAINAECSDLHGAVILAGTLAAAETATLDAAIAGYLRLVIDDEWSAMADGKLSQAAAASFRRLYQQTARLEAVPPGGEILSLLSDAHRQRETRLFQMTLGVPAVLWLLLLLFSAVLVVFVLFSAAEGLVAQMAFAGLFAGTIASVLVVVRMLDYPFQGALGLPSADFQATLAKVLALAFVLTSLFIRRVIPFWSNDRPVCGRFGAGPHARRPAWRTGGREVVRRGLCVAGDGR